MRKRSHVWILILVCPIVLLIPHTSSAWSATIKAEKTTLVDHTPDGRLQERIGKTLSWSYPRGGPRNTSCLHTGFAHELSEPSVRWIVEALEGDVFKTHTIIADVDDDGQLEILCVIGSRFPSIDRFLICLSISDGTEKWEFALEKGERCDPLSFLTWTMMAKWR